MSYRTLGFLEYGVTNGQFQHHGHYINFRHFFRLGPRFIYLQSVNLKSFTPITKQSFFGHYFLHTDVFVEKSELWI